MVFIPVSTIPLGKCATYLRIVCAHRPEKAVPHRVHWTVGGDHIEYFGDVSTKMADIITAKLLFNSIVSTLGGRCMMGDLKDFYLGTPMKPADYAYMRIPVTTLPHDIMIHYNLHPTCPQWACLCQNLAWHVWAPTGGSDTQQPSPTTPATTRIPPMPFHPQSLATHHM